MHEQIPIPTKESFPSIRDPLDAEEFIADLWEKGERPIVTVPIQYKSCIAQGLKPHSTWIPGVKVIAATFGRKEYIPSDEERLTLEIDVSLEQIKPRFTGPDKAFHGVVILNGPIPPEKITIH